MKKAILICLLSARLLLAQSAATLKAPIAVDKLPSGDLFALTQESGVYRFHQDGMKLAPAGSFTLQEGQVPTDIVSAIANREPTLFITAMAPPSYARSNSNGPVAGGSVSQYNPDGKLRASWKTRHIPSGLDFDPKTNTLYVASYDTAEIYQAAISEQKETVQLCGNIVGARKLGPVIVDNRREQLLVGEVQNGEIYSFNLKTHKSHLVATGLGSPQALALSPDGQQLFIADAALHKIYSLDLSRPKASPTIFSAEWVYKEPVGLTFLSSGYLVVADDRANALFILSPTGKLANEMRKVEKKRRRK
jgi:sugar lactone lactonase YvrE